MPRKYRKYRKYTKKTKRSTGWGSTVAKAGKYVNTAVAAYQLASKVARMVNVEYKFHDDNRIVAVDNGGIIYNLTDIPTGQTTNDRIGASIKPMRISGRTFVTQNGSAQKTIIRFILFRGKSERRLSFSVDDNSLGMAVLDANAQLVIAPKLFDNKYDTKFLYDKIYHMSNNGNSSIVLNWDFKLFGHVQYVQGGANDIEDGGLYLLIVSNEGTNTPTVNTSFRISYTDN